MGEPIKKGDLVRFQPLKRTATVEKVATIAVMAGCKPEQLPVVLAIAESGVSHRHYRLQQPVGRVSGPIAKEIGMNSGLGMIGPGNPANSGHRPCLSTHGDQPRRRRSRV